DCLYEKCLFQKRIGITGVTVLVTRGFQIGYTGQVVRIQSLPEARDIVLVIRLIGGPDCAGGSRRFVHRIGRGSVILERFMMRNVVDLRLPVASNVRSAGIVKAPFKPAPGYPLGV